MPTFAQLDGSLVTARLLADAAPTVLPKGRTFVALDDPDAPVHGDAVHGATYDAATRTFSAPAPAKATKVSKTAFLAALGPDLLAAWFASADPVLVFGREMFKADATVSLDSAVIAQVLARGVALGLVKPDAAVAVQAAIAALATTD